MAKDPLEVVGWVGGQRRASLSCFHLRQGFPNGRIIAEKNSLVRGALTLSA